ncbi:MAG: hypothetical protein GY811_16330 [Myxococcales bacterium]|nr:hypothetical protein [Myxococcales bacterium]
MRAVFSFVEHGVSCFTADQVIASTFSSTGALLCGTFLRGTLLYGVFFLRSLFSRRRYHPIYLNVRNL